MPLHFTCPHCGLETLVDDEFAGRSGPCAGCGCLIRVPELSASDRGESAGWEPTGGLSPAATSQLVLLLLAGLTATALAVALVMGLVFPAVQSARAVQQRQACDRNLLRIGQALLAYEQDYGSLPPAYLAHADGRPLHSWRVLLLPYLNEPGLASRYQFAEPWNGPNNTQLTRQMPEYFSCPTDPDARQFHETSYMALTGETAAFPGLRGRPLSELRDPRATTILVVETPVAGVTWTEPKDLSLARFQAALDSGIRSKPTTLHAGGTHVLTADGQVHFLSSDTPAEILAGMATIDGGERIPENVFDP